MNYDEVKHKIFGRANICDVYHIVYLKCVVFKDFNIDSLM